MPRSSSSSSSPLNHKEKLNLIKLLPGLFDCGTLVLCREKTIKGR
jgi:hypothetical protein